jgi:hypothetical protein
VNRLIEHRWQLAASSIAMAVGLSLGATAIVAQEVVAPEIEPGNSRLVTEAMRRDQPGQSSLEAFSTLSAPQIDRQLALYLHYLAQYGRPDILIIGSSRALQGVDPTALQRSLAAAGYPRLKVFNFGINGATAQVEQLLMSRLLKPEQWPRLIVWADGVRAFNSGRTDLTYRKIQDSPGFQQLAAGQRPQLVAKAHPAAAPSTIDDPRQLQGLQVVREVFVPAEYFQRFPKIAGPYDRDYVDFDLTGAQAVATQALLEQTQRRRIPVVFVNLPLTDIYLDTNRGKYEQAFRAYKQRRSALGQLTFIDLGQAWPDRYDYFADPSHINQHGAKAVGTVLGEKLAAQFQTTQFQTAQFQTTQFQTTRLGMAASPPKRSSTANAGGKS